MYIKIYNNYCEIEVFFLIAYIIYRYVVKKSSFRFVSAKTECFSSFFEGRHILIRCKIFLLKVDNRGKFNNFF